MEQLKKLPENFYLQDTLSVAKQLLGKYIVRIKNNEQLILKITETEGYIGPIDKACHAYPNKRTPRTDSLFLKGGNAYVYMIYGMYYCLNVVTEKEDIPCAVLIRGAVPITSSNLDALSLLRYNKPYNELTKYQLKNFANGPGKLCKALEITKSFDKESLLEDKLYICEGEPVDLSKIQVGKRINIDYAEEAKDFLWRFFIQ